jgi:hypothetical protein
MLLVSLLLDQYISLAHETGMAGQPQLIAPEKTTAYTNLELTGSGSYV